MQGSTSGFADRLFGSQKQIAIMDHLAERTRLHLDARFASAQLYDYKRKRLRVVAEREFASGLLSQFGHDVCESDAPAAGPYSPCDLAGPFHSVAVAGNLIGVTSCHFAGCAKPTKSEMNFVRASCEFASDAIVEIRRIAAQ